MARWHRGQIGVVIGGLGFVFPAHSLLSRFIKPVIILRLINWYQPSLRASASMSLVGWLVGRTNVGTVDMANIRHKHHAIVSRNNHITSFFLKN